MPKLAKRLLCIALILAAVVGLFVLGTAQENQPIEDPECYQHGDVNGDGHIDNNDAFYILYHSLIDEESYPIRQAWDYNEDEATDLQDAFHILYHNLVDEEMYALKGTIHCYYDPLWAWSEDGEVTAQVTFKCGCGQPAVYTTANGVTVTAGETVAATCVQAGTKSYSATVTVDGQLYENTYVATLPAGNGHDMTTGSCTVASVCKNGCGYTVPAPDHSWVLEKAEAATCTADAYEVYRCSVCGEPKTETKAGTAGHTLQYLKDVQSGCKFTKWYKCVNCDHEEAGKTAADTYYNHTYTATLTKEATCVETGVKTYKCTCNDSYTEEIPVNDSHNWKAGAPVNGVTTHTCQNSGCTATKTTVEATNETELSKEALTNELQLDGGASMALDEKTVEALDAEKTVQVSIEPLAQDHELMEKLTEEQKEQIGDNTVYDFNMAYSDGTKISDFAGEVTISLPYTLQPGEDIDSIDVWYIDDNGNATRVTGTYANGLVTFTTNHFSYYTVTRLTPAERCERYGHMMTTAKKAATCTADGYEMEVCQRCGYEAKNTVLERTGHDYTTTTVEATCVKVGTTKDVCGNCGKVVTAKIPALGHDMKTDDSLKVLPTCSAAGKTVQVCQRTGCDHKKEEALPQLSHDYKTQTVVEADCSNKGYELRKCASCGEEITVNETAPLGHNFDEKSVTWSWSADHLSATASLVCTHNKAHTKQLTAVVTTKNVKPSCTEAGGMTSTATASFNNVTYTDSYTEAGAAKGHTPGAVWEKDATGHYHICVDCGEQMDKMSHTWDDGKVLTAPTCDKTGAALYTCVTCSYEQEKTLPATREHTYENGVCTGCGKEESACLHFRTTEEELDLSVYDICEGSRLTKISCECGENTSYEYSLFCKLELVDSEETENGEKSTYRCAACGLTANSHIYTKQAEDACQKIYVEEIVLQKGDVEIAREEMEIHTQLHSGNRLLETVDLSQFGLCGEKLEIYTCDCQYDIRTVRMTERCQWSWYDGNGAVEKYRCDKCGAEKIEENDYQEPLDGCLMVDNYTYTYYVDGKQVYTVTDQYVYEEHDYYVSHYEMFGDSCLDGVYYEVSCRNCSLLEEVYTTNHGTALETYEDLSQYDLCASGITQMICPCGETWERVLVYPEEDTDCEWEKVLCKECGLLKTYEYSEELDDECTMHMVQKVTLSKDGVEIGQIGYSRLEYDCHDEEIVEKTLMGETCEDGVKIVSVCRNCKEMIYKTHYGHAQYEVETYDLSQYGFCGGMICRYECLCGENKSMNWEQDNSFCQWEWDGYDGDEEGGTSYHICYNCNGRYENEERNLPSEDPCVRPQENVYRFYTEDSEEPVLTFSYTEEYNDHDMLAQFVLNDEELGCSGGYKVIETCKDCGMTDEWYNDGDAGHNHTYLIDQKTYTIEGMCGEILLETYSCPCGINIGSRMVDEDCRWEWCGDDTYRCEECGIKRAYTSSETKIPGTCYLRYVETYTYMKGDEVLAVIDVLYTQNNHRMVYTFNMYGQTCEEGYDVIGTCQECGMEALNWDYGHYPYAIQRETKVNDPDMCGPVEEVLYSCPCGEIRGADMTSPCNWNHYGHEDGKELSRCEACGAVRCTEEFRQKIEGTCKTNVTREYTYLVGEKTYEVSYTITESDHDYTYRFEMYGESCTDGYTAYRQCTLCDYEEEWSRGSDHHTYRVAYYDLSDYGACGGEVYKSACPCGQEQSWGWSLGYCNGRYAGEKIPGTDIDMWNCNSCNLTFGWGEESELDKENCIMDGTFYFLLKDGDEVLLNIAGESRRQHHETHIVDAWTDVEGGSCEDGVNFIWECENCGIRFDGRGSSHEKFVQETIDLKAYGAVCDSKLYIRRCACGVSTQVTMDECDIDMDSTELWISNALNGEQENVSGWNRVESNAYIYKCAVTDPISCGLTIRMANYWKQEGCYAVNYEIWQLGYDEATGTYQRELSFATGRRELFHDYERTEFRTDNTNGYREVCKNCGSEHFYEDTYYIDGEHYSTNWEYSTNTLGDGWPQRAEAWRHYDRIGDHGGWITYYRYECTNADGSVEWTTEEYEYENCIQYVYHENSHGSSYVNQYEQHLDYNTIYEHKSATCSQVGYEKYWHGCKACGETFESYDRIYEPGHEWSGTPTGNYQCYVCGLENKNGADGDIILEDLTQEYGNGVDYVIGRYNSKNLPVVINVSVILDDATEGENQYELILKDIRVDESKEYSGIAFDKADADNAAAAKVAELGYTGSYAIRVSFIPAGGDTTLDYAITFDSVMAQ